MKLSPTLTKQYIEQRDEEYWIEGTRISLDSVVYAFLEGESPESIAQNFPLLSLEQIYGAITFYSNLKYARQLRIWFHRASVTISEVN